MSLLYPRILFKHHTIIIVREYDKIKTLTTRRALLKWRSVCHVTFQKKNKPEEPRPRCTSYRNEGAAGNKPKQKRSYTTREQWFFIFSIELQLRKLNYFSILSNPEVVFSPHPRTHRINVWAPIREINPWMENGFIKL